MNTSDSSHGNHEEFIIPGQYTFHNILQEASHIAADRRMEILKARLKAVKAEFAAL